MEPPHCDVILYSQPPGPINVTVLPPLIVGALEVTPEDVLPELLFPDGVLLVTELPLVTVPEETTPGPPLTPGPAEVVLPEVVV